MSAEKGTSSEKTKLAINPEAAAEIVVDLINLVSFHQNMGVETYQKTPGLENFLDSVGLVDSARGTDAPAKTRTQQAEPVRTVAQLKPVRKPMPPQDSAERQRLLDAIHEESSICRLCQLEQKRSGVIVGQGSVNAELVVVGDWCQQTGQFSTSLIFSPDEDVMFWKMMEAIGLSRDRVYVTNVFKCCPGQGQSVEAQWAKQCMSYLYRQINAIQPQAVLAMGDLAAGILLQTEAPLFRLRGRLHNLRGFAGSARQAIATYHPRFLLQHPEMKKAAWHDLQRLQKYLQNPQN